MLGEKRHFKGYAEWAQNFVLCNLESDIGMQHYHLYLFLMWTTKFNLQGKFHHTSFF